MTPERRRAARHLLDVLQRENGQLDALDYRAVGEGVAEKQAAIIRLQTSPSGAKDTANEADRTLARDLAAQAERNRIGLERALRVQDRIMGIVAEAARRSIQPPQYARDGGRIARSSPAMAMVVRA